MKKTLPLIALFLIATTSFSQQFGIRGGVNIAKIKASSEGVSVGFDDITSFHIGVVYDTPISNSFYFNSGVLLSQKGYKAAIMGIIDYSVRINYLQVPINLAYKYQVGNAKIFAQTGPFVSYAVSGKSKGTVMGENVDGDINFGSKEEDIRRVDYGLGIAAGIEVERIQFAMGYDFGMADIQNTSNTKTITRTLQIYVCYFF